MQVILSLFIIGFITLIYLSFFTLRVGFFEEYAIFTLGKLRILKLKGRSYAYLIYFILKHAGKKQKKHRNKKLPIGFRTYICIFIKRNNTFNAKFVELIITNINYLYPEGLFKKIKLVSHDKYGFSLAIRMLA